jgi:hypothetical protein
MKSQSKSVLTLIFLFGFFAACTYPENKSKDGVGKFADVEKLSSFKIPTEGDPHLTNKESIPDGIYKLTSLQAEIQYWATNTTIIFSQSYLVPGTIAGDEPLYVSVTKPPTSELVLPFYLKIFSDFKMASAIFNFGTSKDFSAQISTLGQSNWGTKTANSSFSSVYQIMSFTTGKTGIYSLSSSGQTNTIYLLKEDDGSITIYLKRLMSSEADYVKLTYSK